MRTDTSIERKALVPLACGQHGMHDSKWGSETFDCDECHCVVCTLDGGEPQKHHVKNLDFGQELQCRLISLLPATMFANRSTWIQSLGILSRARGLGTKGQVLPSTQADSLFTRWDFSGHVKQGQKGPGGNVLRTRTIYTGPSQQAWPTSQPLPSLHP